MTGGALLEGGRPGIPTEKAMRIDQARGHSSLDLRIVNWFKINGRLEPIHLLMDWEWD